MNRLDSIAFDAELQEKSTADLQRLGELILTQCREAVEQQNSAPATASNAGEESGRKPRDRGPKVKVGGVFINAKTLLSQMEYLKPLDVALPADKNERSKWVLDMKVKACHWDCDWTREDDSKLLQGML